jgi:Na+/H+ antiporter NhaD/arsenite permease-like protein
VKQGSRFILLVLIILSAFLVTLDQKTGQAQEITSALWILGSVSDAQLQPVKNVIVRLLDEDAVKVISETETQSDGRFALPVPSSLPENIAVELDRNHFENVAYPLSQSQLLTLNQSDSLTLPEITMEREITAAFWISAGVFILVLILIATGFLHNTLAAFSGVSLLLAVSYLGGSISDNFVVYNFDRALTYIDWNVIFLIMGMMMVIAVVERTGVFHWLAYFAYRISGGRMWVLLPVLMLITGIASAFLDNVTTMLLMTPISVQIALALNISPIALLIPEVLASNVIGVSTLIGTPTNILIGSFADITFNDFLLNLTPGVVLAFIGLTVYSWLTYRKDFKEAKTGSQLLLKKLEERGKITKPQNLKKAGWIGGLMLILFVFGESIHLLPAVTALIGAAALLVWIRPDIEEMISAVDWTTLVFFMSLFMVVGAIQEVGLVSYIASFIGQVIGQNLMLGMVLILWMSAILSMVIANIPFTAAMLPVIGYLSRVIPGADNKALFYCLSIGAAMGGNGSLIGASANMITAGIADRAGYKITYQYFLKKGLPAVLITISLAMIWLFIRF